VSTSVHPALEARLRQKAEAEGLSVEAYVERLLRSEELADEELERLALEGLNSGEPIEITPGYWEEQHRRLDHRLKKTGVR
jgi:antitoxin ParD1/3/4